MENYSHLPDNTIWFVFKCKQLYVAGAALEGSDIPVVGERF